MWMRPPCLFARMSPNILDNQFVDGIMPSHLWTDRSARTSQRSALANAWKKTTQISSNPYTEGGNPSVRTRSPRLQRQLLQANGGDFCNCRSKCINSLEVHCLRYGAVIYHTIDCHAISTGHAGRIWQDVRMRTWVSSLLVELVPEFPRHQVAAYLYSPTDQ